MIIERFEMITVAHSDVEGFHVFLNAGALGGGRVPVLPDVPFLLVLIFTILTTSSKGQEKAIIRSFRPPVSNDSVWLKPFHGLTDLSHNQAPR